MEERTRVRLNVKNRRGYTQVSWKLAEEDGMEEKHVHADVAISQERTYPRYSC